MRKDIRKLIDNILRVVENHKLDTGAYARWVMDNGKGRQMGVNEYGCADAANILYMIGEFPRDIEERQRWISVMQDMQNPETGLFVEATHHTIHTTAHVSAALELFDARPKHKFVAFEPYMTKEGLFEFLDNLEWDADPWRDSHQGAGLYAALTVAEQGNAEWNKWYFEWLWNEACPETGLWRRGCANSGVSPKYAHMAGSFHYLFNHEHAKMPLRYPEKLIDTCLEMYYAGDMNNGASVFGKQVGFLEIDWVYCITRALRQCKHRFDECVETLTDFADKYLDYLMSLDPDTSVKLDDIHCVFGALCCVAELQTFLPGSIITEKPLKLVLDRRPFI